MILKKNVFQRVHIKFCVNTVVGINVIKCVLFVKVMNTILQPVINYKLVNTLDTVNLLQFEGLQAGKKLFFPKDPFFLNLEKEIIQVKQNS